MRIMITIGVDGEVLSAVYQELEQRESVEERQRRILLSDKPLRLLPGGRYGRAAYYRTVRQLRHEQQPDGTIKVFLYPPEPEGGDDD